MTADFFDELYADAGNDDTAVPWQHAISRRIIGAWLATFEPDGHRRAIVVAAGLGDDAAALADHGLEVVAFDRSPTAVAWARSRHPDAGVDWHVADLFATPAAWRASFDLVVEVFTVQSLAPARQDEAVTAIRDLLEPGGTLVAVTLVHDGRRDPEGPPWPVHPSTLERLLDGLIETDRWTEPLDRGVSCVLVEAVRPADD